MRVPWPLGIRWGAGSCKGLVDHLIWVPEMGTIVPNFGICHAAS